MHKKSSLLIYTKELFLLTDLLSQSCAFADVDFQALCNRSEHIYGPPSKSGQGKRRLFQKRFHQIQKLSKKGLDSLFDSYNLSNLATDYYQRLANLEINIETPSHGIHPTSLRPTKELTSPETMSTRASAKRDSTTIEGSLAQTTSMANETADDDSTGSDDSGYASAASSGTELSYEDVNQAAEGLAGLTLAPKNLFSPTKTDKPILPAEHTMFSPVTRPMTASTPLFMSPDSVSKANGSSASKRTTRTTRASAKKREKAKKQETELDKDFRLGLEFMRLQNGTKQAPFWIIVDPSFPERNVAGLHIQRVTGVENARYERTLYHIKMMADPQYAKLQLSIPIGLPKELKNRVLMLRRPAISGFFTDIADNHRAGQISCPATKKAHTQNMTQVTDDENRQWIYTMLLFPFRTYLDNPILSQDDHIVPTQAMATKMTLHDAEITGIHAYWRIAEHGGRKIANEHQTSTMADLLS